MTTTDDPDPEQAVVEMKTTSLLFWYRSARLAGHSRTKAVLAATLTTLTHPVVPADAEPANFAADDQHKHK